MKALGGLGIAVILALVASGVITAPPLLDIAEEANIIDLPEENPVIYQIEKFGEQIRYNIEIDKHAWEQKRVMERATEYFKIRERNRANNQTIQFTDERTEHIWSVVEERTGLSREQLWNRINEKVEELKTRKDEIKLLIEQLRAQYNIPDNIVQWAYDVLDGNRSVADMPDNLLGWLIDQGLVDNVLEEV